MKTLLTILILTISYTTANAQLTPTQERQVKVKTDSIAKVLRAEVRAWTDNKRTIDSTQNMNLKRDSADFVTVKIQVLALIKDLAQYQLIETIPMTPAELEAFSSFLDKIKNLANILK